MPSKVAFILTAISILLASCVARRLDPANLRPSVCAATSLNTCDWMSLMLAAHPDRSIALTDICLPGSHDAGMYTTQHCTAFAHPSNTQTQYLDMRHQLEAGLRIFDLRPWLYEREYYTHHSTKCDWLGCKGGKMRDILIDTRTFVDAHAEIVLLMLSHPCHVEAMDSSYLALLTETLGDRIYRDNEMTEKSPALIHMPLRQIVPPGSKTGKVILLIEGMPDNATNRTKGWFSADVLTRAGGWSDDNHYSELREHQLQRFAAYTGNGSALYELAWQITQHDAQAVRSAFDPHSPTTIRKGAANANTNLAPLIDSLITSGSIHRGKIPNIIWDDLADTMVTHQAIKLTELNLK